MGEVKKVVGVPQLGGGSVRVQPGSGLFPSTLLPSHLALPFLGETPGGTTTDSWGQRALGRQMRYVSYEFNEAHPVRRGNPLGRKLLT